MYFFGAPEERRDLQYVWNDYRLTPVRNQIKVVAEKQLELKEKMKTGEKQKEVYDCQRNTDYLARKDAERVDQERRKREMFRQMQEDNKKVWKFTGHSKLIF